MSDPDSTETQSIVGRTKTALLDPTALERVGLGVASTVLAFLIGVVVVAAAGHSPTVFVRELLIGAVGSQRSIALTLRETTMFVLTGTAVAVAFRAGIFNIGVQGQFILGGFVSTITVLQLVPVLPANALGGAVLILSGLVTGIAAGGAYAMIPGLLKAYADANEIITTIMLNFIATGVVLFLLSGPFQGADQQAARSESFPDYVTVPAFVFETRSFSVLGLLAALVAVIAAYVLLTRTRLGYDMVTSGYQQAAAVYSGVHANRTVVGTMTISGMIAGLGGALFSVMVLGGYVNPQGIHTYGFDAIAVSLLAANNPLGVIPASLLFGGMVRGGSFVGITTDVPAQLVNGIVGLVVLFVATPELFRLVVNRGEP